MLKKIKLLSIYFFFTLTFSGHKLSGREVSVSIGMIQNSFSETELNLDGPNAGVPESGTQTLISSMVSIEAHSFNKIKLVVAGTFPILLSQGGSYFSGMVIGDYYFTDFTNRLTYKDKSLSLKAIPSFRYFASAAVLGTMITYRTTSALKSDGAFGIGAGGGASYMFNDNYAIKARLLLSRETGTISETITMQFFAGLLFFL